MTAKKQKKQKPGLKMLWHFLYIIGTFLIIYFLGFADPEFANIGERINQFSPAWLWLCFGCVIGFWLLQSVVFHITSRFMSCRISYWKNLKITLIGEYYSAITPFSTGGQPMQMGYYKRYGVNLATSTCILAVRFIGYVLSMCIFFIVTMITRGDAIYRDYNALFWLTAVGFLINFITVLFLIFVLINRKLVITIGLFIIRIITKLKILRRKKESMTEKFMRGVDEFAVAGKFLKTSGLKSLAIIAVSLLSIASLYSITYCIYRGVGLSSASYIDLFTMQIFLYLAVSFFPTPGAIGASEGGFYLFFGAFFSQNMLYFAMIMWRLFTYYSNLIVGAIMIVWDELYYILRGKKREDSEPAAIGGDTPDAEQTPLHNGSNDSDI